MWKAFAGGLALLGAVALPAYAADEFPGDKTIEVVIHAKYGGGTDTTARMMMIRSRRILGTDMVVVSKRGGGGAAAQAYVNGKPADGYTLMALTQTHLYTMARGKGGMEIADMVGASRAMVSRILKDLKAGGYISVDKKRITIQQKLPSRW